MKIKKKRKKTIRTEKRFGEIEKKYGRLLVATGLSWSLVFLVILKVDPDNLRDLLLPNSYILFLLLLLLACFFLLSVILMSSKRAWWWSVLVVIFIYLRLIGMGGLINGLLLLAMGVVFDVYQKLKG